MIIGADLLIAFVTFVMVLAIPHISSEPALLGGLLVMSVIRSLGAGIQTPAVNAVIPQLVPEDQLMRYNGINATMQSIVNFAAPAAAGAVFAISTLRMTLMIDIVTAILGTGLLSCLALPKQNTSIEKASVFSDMKIGVKYAFADKLIGKLLIIYGLFTFFCVPAGYLAGLLVRRVFGDTYWYLTAVEVVGFAGMMAGGVIMSTWGGFKHRGKTLAVGLFAFGSFAIGMGFSKNFIFYLGLMVCYGVALLMELSIDRLTKQYQNKIAVDRISLRLNTGIYGLLGANGAGKTTLMRMVCGILKPTSGTITFDGIDVSEERYRSMLGYLPQDFGYYPEFTGEDFLLYMAALKGMRKPQARRKTVELLKLVSLHDVAKKKIKTYSGGMKQRLGIAQALLNQPKLLVLDEPTAGLDPKERVRFRDLIKDLGKDSIVLLSTHIVSDIEHIADDILMMKSGQLIYQGKWTDKSGNLEEFYLKQFEEIE